MSGPDMKRVQWTGPKKQGRILHIETEGATINVRTGLSDSEGRKVTSVEIIPEDESRSADLDDHYWHIDGHRNNRLIRQEHKVNDAQSLAAYVADARKTAHGDSNDSEIQAWQDLGEHLETMLADGRLVFTDGSTYVPPSTDGDED